MNKYNNEYIKMLNTFYSLNTRDKCLFINDMIDQMVKGKDCVVSKNFHLDGITLIAI